LTEVTRYRLDPRRDTPLLLLDCPADLSELADPEKQAKARETYETPGIVAVDNAVGEDVLAGLREGLTFDRRKFKDKFNQGIPKTPTFVAARNEAARRITALARALFGYTLPDYTGADMSYRPMVTENEPMHFDGYMVECGKTPLMSILNFDVLSRFWQVGPSFNELCKKEKKYITKVLNRLRDPYEVHQELRGFGMKGGGPLGPGEPVHRVEFAPGTIWFANPKTIAHQIVYGNGALFVTWIIDEPMCKCQKCTLEANGIRLREPEPEAVAPAE